MFHEKKSHNRETIRGLRSSRFAEILTLYHDMKDIC